MPTDLPPSIRAEAIAWHVRLRNEPEGDWDAFVDWLERDPRHSPAYDEVVLADEDVGNPLADLPVTHTSQANDNVPPAIRRATGRRWAIGSLGATAAAAALLMFSPLMQTRPDLYEISTPPGQSRTVAINGHDRVALNGASTIRLDRHNPRFAALAAGEAMFDIVHDPKAPFVLALDNNRIVDVGTRFNVVRTVSGHVVEVAEGSILYNPEREHITLAAGQTLTSKTDERKIVLAKRPMSEIGDWQRGRLSYTSRPLASVAADLARNLGTSIAVHPAIADRQFTGTIEIDRNETRMFARLSKLLGVDAQRGKGGWALGPEGNTAS